MSYTSNNNRFFWKKKKESIFAYHNTYYVISGVRSIEKNLKENVVGRKIISFKRSRLSRQVLVVVKNKAENIE